MRHATPLVLLTYVVGCFQQSLSGELLSCVDSFEACKINCVFPMEQESELAFPFIVPDTMQTLQLCLNSCQTTSCSDSHTVKTVNKCVKSCAESYDSEISSCILDTSSVEKMTFNANLDYCANTAGYTMDTCFDSCSGTDKFDGWTLEKENGVKPEMRVGGDSFVLPKPEKYETEKVPPTVTSTYNLKRSLPFSSREVSDEVLDQYSARGAIVMRNIESTLSASNKKFQSLANSTPSLALATQGAFATVASIGMLVVVFSWLAKRER